MSTVDVVVPCYRYAHYLRECVHSVLSQEGVNLRVMIIDDASPDNTPEIARQLVSEDSRVSYTRHDKNKGHIATYNEGIEWVKASYYLLLSADDYLLPGALARATALLDCYPNATFCYGNALELQPDGTLLQVQTGMYPGKGMATHVVDSVSFFEMCQRCGSINIVPTPTAVVRTATQKRLDGYKPELQHSGDMELWLRLATHGFVGFIGDNQAVYRVHGENMSLAYFGDSRLRDYRQRQAAIESAFQDCGDACVDTRLHKNRLLSRLALEAVRCASGALNAGNPPLATDLRMFARTVKPTIVFTTAWMRLMCKYALGPRMSRALLPMLQFFRKRAAALVPPFKQNTVRR